jgi:hypothetical protein
MEIYSDMVFSGPEPDMRDLLEKLDSLGAVGGWKRDRGAELGVAPLLAKDDVVRSYRGKPLSDVEEAILWLDVAPGRWSVTNIVPTGATEIAPPDYARLLASFRSAVLANCAGATIKVTEPVSSVGPEHFLSPAAVERFRAFARLANKSTGAAHPRDRARWNEFVIAAHLDSCGIGAAEVSSLLIENEGWPKEKASELGLLFEYEISLLNDLRNSR